MYDADKVIAGIVIFLIIVLVPVWYIAASGQASYRPEPEIVTEETHCVEDTEFMKDEHMQLLIDWKDSVVRQGIRTYVASDGEEYTMSLTNTCLECHPNKAEFCDQCHDYAGVQPYCWDCHNIPDEEQ